ncbi:interference hedgehog-like [Pectinophora gossypiella]|uniref:interference hedgehog-like n=1 Tax=Pectinophora gossypiella TaxID=13191 RepID=UPI00214EEBED|nr:interference hedgehog-like [Pectinophora gossypiella]
MAPILFLQLILAVIATVLAEIEMEFTKYPESVTAPVGDEVTFECAVRVPGERLAWRWRPVDKPDDVWKDVPGVTDKDTMSTRLVVEVKDSTPNSLYQCVVWYGAISLASIPARLSIARLELSRNSPRKRMITAPAGNTVVLHCKEPQSEPPAVLSWWKDTGRTSRKQLDTPHGVLVIHNATAADSGTYGCTATNEISSQVVDLPETTYLKVQRESGRGVRFLEEDEYVGTVDSEGVLTVPIRPGGALRLWCGAVDSPPPRVTWTKEGENIPRHHDNAFVINPFTSLDEGIYTCTANPAHPIRRSWKVLALQPPRWEEPVASVNTTEGSSAHVACGTPFGQPPPAIYWLLNAEPLREAKGIRASGSDLYIERAEKKHAGIVQCFACNDLGCAYDAALLTVVPMQISDQQYPAETSAMHFPSQSPKRHNRKNPRKHKAVLIPPSRPNVTRMSDESVMVTWSHVNHGLPIQFYKVQYREVTANSSSNQWHTESYDIPPHIHSYEVDQLIPDRFYKFRVAAVYSNQDNKSGKSSVKFHLRRGGPPPPAPVFTKAVALSTNTIQLNWTWSGAHHHENSRDPVIGFYVYYRALSTAGAYEKVIAPVTSRSMVLTHLSPDMAYELKIQAYTEQAPSPFSSILIAKTHKLLNTTGTTEAPPDEVKSEGRAPGALVTAGGALGVGALLVILAVTLLLCRRAKRPPANKEKGSVPESGGTNGYIPAKVPITITANPMHAEGGDGSVEMSFLHNNNTGSNDDTLPHSRKNGPTRQYV